MTIEPQEVNIKEHGKHWLIEAYIFYREKIITLTTIVLLYILSFNLIIPIIKENIVLEALVFFLFKYVFATLFMYYSCCIFYEADNNKPPINIKFDFKKIRDYSLFLFSIDLIVFIILFVIFLTFNSPEQSDSVNNTINLFGDNNNIIYSLKEFYNNIISVFIFPVFLSIFFCIVFMNFNLKDSLIWTTNATIEKNITLLLITIVATSLYTIFSSFIPVIHYVMIFAGPYILSLCYVVIKHIFFNMSPSHKKLKETKQIFQPQTS